MLQIGHRGAAGLAPENTIVGIRRALACGVDMIELDLQLCKSGDIVCHHDTLINRMSNGWGAVKNLHLSQLRELTFKGEPIPTLQEAFDAVNNEVPLNIDIKDEGTGIALVEFLRTVPKSTRDNLLVSSRRKSELMVVKAAFPEIPLGLITVGLNPMHVPWAARHELSFVSVPNGWLRRPFVQMAQRRGLEVFAFPYGHRTKMNRRRLARLGVDGAMYNYPGVNPF